MDRFGFLPCLLLTFLALTSRVVVAKTLEGTQSGCLAHLLTAASVSKSDASKYEGSFARYKLDVAAVKSLPAPSLNLLLGLSPRDAHNVRSCFQRSPKSSPKCQRLTSFECHGRGVCRAMAKSKPYFQCVCRSSFSGVLCERRPNYCKPRNPCANSGVCHSNDKGFTCRCPHGYSGSTCQDFWMSEKVFDKKLSKIDVEHARILEVVSAIQRKEKPKSRKKKFAIIKKAMSHSAAQKACSAKGLQLAVPRSNAENGRIGKLCSAYKVYGCWLGINDVRHEGKWVDLNRKPLRYTRWDTVFAKEPNGGKGSNCGHMFASRHYKHTWNDDSCGRSYLPACESL